MAVKENGASKNRSPYPEPRGSPFKKRPCGPVLKVRQQNPKTPGALRGWVWGSLVPAAACHFAQTKKERTALPSFLERHIISRGLNRGMLPHAEEFRPLRRSTRRCPPWTRTGLMPGDRKAARYWALAFGYGAAPQKPRPPQSVKGRGIASPCTRLDSRHPLSLPHIVKARQRRVGSGFGLQAAMISCPSSNLRIKNRPPS